MCGILFYIGNQRISDDHASLAALRRRGPDAFQHTSHGPFHTAFSRLAIIGSNGTSGRVGEWTPSADDAGMQPLLRGGLAVLCNGEIFNYKEISHQRDIPLMSLRNDIDLLTHLTLDSAAEWLPRLNGDFAGVLFSPDSNRFLLFRDPVGVRPLYIGRDANDAIVAAGSLMATVAAIQGVVDISEFPPGHSYDSAVGVMKRYAHELPPAGQLTDRILAQELIYEQLYAAVRRRLLHSNVPVAFLCSGGLDSSILLTIGHQIWTSELHQPASALHAFSIEYMDERGNSTSQDTFYAKCLTKALGVSHTVFKFTQADIEAHLDDILTTVETDDHRTLRAAVPQYFLGRAIRTHTPYRVILSGEGADELFLGYNYMNRCPNAAAAEAESRRLVENIHRFDVLRAERAMAAWGLELRVPYLDSRFVRLAQSMSGRLRNTNKEKELLRESFAAMEALSSTRILDRGKEKFSDGCGFDYVPVLMRILTERGGGDASRSAHLLEGSEKAYVKAVFDRRFKGFKTASNSEFRELPDWIPREDRGPKHGNLLGAEEEKGKTYTVTLYNDMGHLMTNPEHSKIPDDIRAFVYKKSNNKIREATTKENTGCCFYILKPGLSDTWTYQYNGNTVIIDYSQLDTFDPDTMRYAVVAERPKKEIRNPNMVYEPLNLHETRQDIPAELKPQSTRGATPINVVTSYQDLVASPV